MKINYREDQKKILDYEKGLMSVPSVPGAGKTFMLIELSKKLSRNLEEEKKILILTYMNSAVETIKERLDVDKNEMFEVMTIHSFAMKILKENTYKANVSDDFIVISDQDKSLYIMKMINSEISKVDILKILESKDYLEKAKKDILRICLNFISYLKLNSYILEKESAKSELSKLVHNIVREYSDFASRKSYLDYDDILYIGLNLLKMNKEILMRYQNEYQYIIEDESQDSNFVQNNILNILAKDGNLIRFGDMNQSIMSFANSEPELYRDFTRKNIKKEILSAGRSSLEIISIINFFVKYIKNEHPLGEVREALEEQMIRAVKDGELPRNPINLDYSLAAFKFESQKDELDKISNYVIRFKERFPDKKVAVLFTNRYLMGSFADRLGEKKIEYSYLDGIDIREIGALQKLGKILAFISEPYNRNRYYELFKLLENKDLDFRMKTRDFEIEDLIEVEYKELKDKTALSDSEVGDIITFNKKINKILSFPKNSLEALLIYISDSLKLNSKEMELISAVLIDIKQLYKLNPRLRIKDLSEKILDLRENRYAYTAKKIFNKTKIKEENVVLSTYHKSKGKEWDAVFLTGLTEDSFPCSYNSKFKGEFRYFNEVYKNPLETLKSEISGEESSLEKSRKNKIEEMIRVLYVGLSRAKEYLYISTNIEKGASIYFEKLKEKIDLEKKEWKN